MKKMSKALRQNQKKTHSTSSLIAERATTHGQWWHTALASTILREALHSIPGYTKLTPNSRESLEMIQVKIARIISGSEFHLDHWRDISGYAMLNVQEEPNEKA